MGVWFLVARKYIYMDTDLELKLKDPHTRHNVFRFHISGAEVRFFVRFLLLVDCDAEAARHGHGTGRLGRQVKGRAGWEAAACACHVSSFSS